uniref:Uncharacterized protein n=1 Tax=Arundo donax TaxID=35708 RepID=A0A0A9EKJ8_ARUDO
MKEIIGTQKKQNHKSGSGNSISRLEE